MPTGISEALGSRCYGAEEVKEAGKRLIVSVYRHPDVDGVVFWVCPRWSLVVSWVSSADYAAAVFLVPDNPHEVLWTWCLGRTPGLSQELWCRGPHRVGPSMSILSRLGG